MVAGAGLALAICTKVAPVALLGYYLANQAVQGPGGHAGGSRRAGCDNGEAPTAGRRFSPTARLFPSLTAACHGYGFFVAGRSRF